MSLRDHGAQHSALPPQSKFIKPPFLRVEETRKNTFVLDEHEVIQGTGVRDVLTGGH
jgi:hypothetical protein